MEVIKFLRVLRRWWWLLSLGVVLSLLVTLLFVPQSPPMYQASARLFIDEVQAPGPATLSDVQTSQQLAKTYSEVLISRSVLAQVVVQFNLPFSPDDLARRVTVTPVRDTAIIQVFVKDIDANRASATANGITRVFINYVQDLQARRSEVALQQVDRDIDAVQSQITATSARLNQINTSIDQTSTTARQIDQLQQQLSQYDQDLRDIRQRSADISSRLIQLRNTPDSSVTSASEIQALQAQLTQLEKDAQDIRARYADTSNQLDRLRSAPVPRTADQAEAQRLQDQLSQYQDKYRQLLDTRQTIVLKQSQSAAAVTITDPAQIPSKPVPSHSELRLPIAGSVGLLIALVVALIREYFDDRLQDADTLQDRFNIVPLTILGRLRPRAPRFGLRHRSEADVADFRDALLLLRANLDIVAAKHPTTVCLTSAVPREGKSTVALNLAIVEADAAIRVVLVDGNLRDPTLHQRLGLLNHTGLSTFLAASDGDDNLNLQDGPHGLKVLTSGPVPRNASDLLASPRMNRLMEILRRNADLILLDAAALLIGPDALLLTRHADGVLLVVDADHTPCKVLARALSRLKFSSTDLYGAVVNRARRISGIGGYSRSRPREKSHRFDTRANDGENIRESESGISGETVDGTLLVPNLAEHGRYLDDGNRD